MLTPKVTTGQRFISYLEMGQILEHLLRQTVDDTFFNFPVNTKGLAFHNRVKENKSEVFISQYFEASYIIAERIVASNCDKSIFNRELVSKDNLFKEILDKVGTVLFCRPAPAINSKL